MAAMENQSRRSGYGLLNQYPKDRLLLSQSMCCNSSPSGELKSSNSDEDKARDFDSIGSHRTNQLPRSRMRSLILSHSTGLQTQSSGSSLRESSLSGDYYAPALSTPGGNEMDEYGHVLSDGKPSATAAISCDMSEKTWAQQTEESYQLQLALALRLASEASRSVDPNYLDAASIKSMFLVSGSTSPEVMSFQFWANGDLSYTDKIPDGFYAIYGMDSYMWALCTDLQANDHIPSIEMLRSIDYQSDSLLEVVLVNRYIDPILEELRTIVHGVSISHVTTKEVVDQLAKLVCNHMGGSVTTAETCDSIWMKCSNDLKASLQSVVIPIGHFSFGLCRHRAILFKVLADMIDLPCRIAKGCRYCKRLDASSTIVQFEPDREYLVDLVGKPGCLWEPNSLLHGPSSSIAVSSPLRFPQIKTVEPTIDFRLLAKQYFSDCALINLAFDSVSSDVATVGKTTETNNISLYHGKLKVAGTQRQDKDIRPFKLCNLPQKNPQPMKHVPTIGQGNMDKLLLDTANNVRMLQGNNQCAYKKQSGELSLDVEGLEIPWGDLVLKEKIGAGSFGTVHRADWNGSDVAVKILMVQDFRAEHFKEFLREVAIMKSLRHPNIVLFMGAVTQPPNLSIVTEYLSRGSLYRLLHKSGVKGMLDERRRLCMAYDVARGMNYLHKRKPPIVHRDLKSPNLLVDRKYTVKVCDFGLSRLKASTYLSSKSAAGTPEWMAPEVLRDDPSNEKSDIYSFGVILWELATLQQPWSNLNAAQVVAAVGFREKRLEIPLDLNPHVASLIEGCWANEACKRPSFSSITESLKTLINSSSPQPNTRDVPA